MNQHNTKSNDNTLYISAISLAYDVGNSTEFNESKDIFNDIIKNTGWKLLNHSREYSTSIGRNLKAVALINPETKEICIANAGTRINFFDIFDDIKLAFFNSLPTKLSRMKAFMQEVEHQFSELYNIKPSEMQWKFTGHSLGGVLADLEATEAIRSGKHVTQVVTYDNPGSLPLIKSNNLLYDRDIEQLSKITTSYVAAKNIVNRTNEQLSDDVQLVLPKEVPTEEVVTTKSSGWGGFISSALHKVTDVVSTAFHKVAHATCYALDKVVKKPLDSIGLSYYTAKVLDTVDELGDWAQDLTRIGGHGLANFKALRKYEPDSTDNEINIIKIEEWNKSQPIVRTSELHKLGNTSTGNDVVFLDTTDLDGEDDEYVLVDQYERSYHDLATANQNTIFLAKDKLIVATNNNLAIHTKTFSQETENILLNPLTNYVGNQIAHAKNYITKRLNIVKSNLEPIIEEGIETVAHYFNKQQTNDNILVQYYANNNGGEPNVEITMQHTNLYEDVIPLSGLFADDITC